MYRTEFLPDGFIYDRMVNDRSCKQVCTAKPPSSSGSKPPSSTTSTAGIPKMNFITSGTRASESTVSGLKKTLDQAFKGFAREFPKSTFNTINVTVSDAHTANPGQAQLNNITINGTYIQSRPQDHDIMTHEGFHVLQFQKGGFNVPSWITEGMADYARDKYGRDNAAGGWTLGGRPSGNESYTSGYRTTARFMKWAEKKKPGSMNSLFNAAYINKNYSDSWWTNRFGKSVASLWSEYANDASFRDINEFDGEDITFIQPTNCTTQI